MNNIDYKEHLITESGLNLQLSPHIYLIDLLRLEYFQEVRIELAAFYIKEITKNSDFTFSQKVEDADQNRIILLDDWSVLLGSDSLLYIFLDSASTQSARVNLNKLVKGKGFQGEANSIQLIADSGYTFVILYLCKLWVNSSPQLQEFIGTVDLSLLKHNMRSELASFIYSNSKVSRRSILLAITEAKELLVAPTETTYSVATKPICDVLKLETRNSLESLEYTQSEDTGKIETSFRLSNTITGRFPRLSGSSIALVETPSKDTKKSYAEYAEFMESPRFSSINVSPYKGINNTPVNSPKQSMFSIQEVKNFLLPSGNNYLTNQSPVDKKCIKREVTLGVRPFTFRETEAKSFATDAGMSAEGNHSRTVFEEKKSSCQCQSCNVF